MTLTPAVLLGGLVLGVPNTFAVASNASHTFHGPHGESVEVEATPLTAGSRLRARLSLWHNQHSDDLRPCAYHCDLGHRSTSQGDRVLDRARP